jgi:transposase
MNNQESIRRERYCQMTGEIRNSDQYLVIGIDIAKDKHYAFMGTATGISIYRKFGFENSLDGFSKLLRTVEDVKRQRGLTKAVFGLEPTGNYHKPLARHLIRCDSNVVLVTGQAVKNNRQLLDGRWDKNDMKDAANVSDLVSRGKGLYYDLPADEFLDLRTLLSLRRLQKKEIHRIRMRIRNHLVAQYFPELDRFFSDCESESLAIVRWCLDPKKIAGLEFDDFFRLVTRTTRGPTQRQRLRKIHTLAIDSIGCPMCQAAEYEARLCVEKLELARKQLKQTDALIENICIGIPEYNYLLTIPGFGPYISARVLGAIGDPFRFDGQKQVVKLAGYDLCANRSGKTSNKTVPVISKKGNSELRYALYQAANVAASRTDMFRAYFSKMLLGREREPGIRTKMKTKLAAKLLCIAWTLMKKKEPFDPTYLNI